MTDHTNESTGQDQTAEAILSPADAAKRAEAFLLGNMLKAATRRLREMAVPWGRMTEAEQTAINKLMVDDLRKAAKEAIMVLQAHARIRFRAEVDSVQFKASDIKAALKLAPGHSAHSLADSAGQFVTIVIEEIDELLAIDDAALAGEEDQRPLFD